MPITECSDWAVEGSMGIPEEKVQRSFLKWQISNAMDGTENIFWQEITDSDSDDSNTGEYYSN